MSYTYIGSCVNVTPEDLGKHFWMRQEAKAVKYEEMLEICPDLLDLADCLGYARDPKDGLTLKKDQFVGFFKSEWGEDGEFTPCYYMSWSGFEFIWLGGEHETVPKERPPRAGLCSTIHGEWY